MSKHTFSLTVAALFFMSILIGAFASSRASAQSDTNAARVCIPDSNEPNNSTGAATPVVAGLYTPLSICAGDNDYYSIDVQAGELLNIELLFTHATGDIELILRNPAGSQVASSTSSSDNETLAYRVETSGTHIIRTYGWQAAVENTYQLSVGSSCEGCISYQGQLQASGGNANGSYEFTFKLYDSVANGTQLGQAVTQVLPVVDGLFSAELYFGNASIWAGTYPQFLDISVRPSGSAASATPLTPRTELLPAPVAHTLIPGATISGEPSALTLRSSTQDGLQVTFAQDDGIQILNTGDEGIYIANAGETGIFIDNAGKAAIAAQNTSTVFPAGIFVNTDQTTTAANHSGGIGVYARGKGGTSVADPDAADVILGASAGTGNRTVDDGRISSDPGYSSSDLEMASMDKAWVLLDADNNSTGAYFAVFNHSSETANRVFYVQDDGDVFAKSYNTITRSSGRDGTPIVQYGATAMQQRIEDFGTATLIDGAATVQLNTPFMTVADTSANYQVFLTPRGDCPLYLASTGADSFNVQAMGEETCSIAFDYRVVAAPFDGVEITPEGLLGEDAADDMLRDSAEEVTP